MEAVKKTLWLLQYHLEPLEGKRQTVGYLEWCYAVDQQEAECWQEGVREHWQGRMINETLQCCVQGVRIVGRFVPGTLEVSPGLLREERLEALTEQWEEVAQ